MADEHANLLIGPPPTPQVGEPVVSEPASTTDDTATPVIAHVDESVVRGLLNSMGSGAGYVIGDEDVPNHWHFTKTELDDLTPPLTRIVNRRPQLQRAVMRGDEAAVAVLLAGYAGRNFADGNKAKEARKDADEQREAASTPGSVRNGTDGSGGGAADGRSRSGLPSTPSGHLGG